MFSYGFLNGIKNGSSKFTKQNKVSQTLFYAAMQHLRGFSVIWRREIA
jgi:hypothetical protein